jgi:hypothetical protein
MWSCGSIGIHIAAWGKVHNDIQQNTSSKKFYERLAVHLDNVQGL